MAFDMSEVQLTYDLEHSSSIKLLKADYAALIISFLHQEFKRAQRVALPYTEVIEHLEEYLEYLHEQKPGSYPRTAQAYITTWADPDHRFIRIAAHGNGDVPMVELTSETERAIGWLEDMHARSFNGAISIGLLMLMATWWIPASVRNGYGSCPTVFQASSCRCWSCSRTGDDGRSCLLLASSA